MPFYSESRKVWRGQVKFCGKTYQTTHATKEDAEQWEKKTRYELNMMQLVNRIEEEEAETAKYGQIYFVQAEIGGPIKIGWSTNLASRLKTLKTASPTALRLLGAFPARKSWEKELHQRFHQLRLSGEWFSPKEELMDMISRIVAGKGEAT